MNKIVIVLASAVLALVQVPAHADISLQLSDVVVNAGSTATVTASIADTGPMPTVLSAYNVTLDLTTIPGFTVGANPISQLATFPAFTASTPNPAIGANFDYQIGSSGGSLALSSTPTDLFQITFGVDPSAQPGDVLPVSFELNPTATTGGNTTPLPTFFVLTLDNNTTTITDLIANSETTIDQGSITVVGVPEPSSAALVLAIGGLAACRRRRSR